MIATTGFPPAVLAPAIGRPPLPDPIRGRDTSCIENKLLLMLIDDSFFTLGAPTGFLHPSHDERATGVRFS